ncbi:SGNH/GDSL hydrolase family protein [Aquitalea sp. USM4]|uniref:SGNH/GDSL hydrolase family protein n=1 Tax=Aquitalea sp. USM4 TaxID=1590041 RepID=UPI0013F16CD8|nr:SGNH/GDSL hydrolase family protein [Aquitalea sp. USM4]
MASKSAAVVVTGGGTIGSTLTASIANPSNYALVSWQWSRSFDGGNTWSAISGATSSTYTLTISDVGAIVSASATVQPISQSGAVTVISSNVLVSATMRATIPQATISATSMGTTYTTNNYVYNRWREASARALSGLRLVYANLLTWCTINSTVNNGWMDCGTGASVVVRGGLVIGPTSTSANVGGTPYGATWNSVANQASLGTQQGIDQFIYKLDNTGASPVMRARTYAQFVADGGAVVSSTMNGATVANSQITVPDCYIVISDAGPAVAANTAYYVQSEERGAPQVTVTSVTISAAGSALLQLPSAADSAYYVGGLVNISGATGNTSINGVMTVSAIDRVANTMTVTSSAITTGAVTGTVLLKQNKAQNTFQMLTTTAAFGDFNCSSATQLDFAAKSDWSSKTNTGTEGTGYGSFCAVIGTDPAGGKCVLLHGDSITFGVGDRSTDGPSGNVLLGDQWGGLGWGRRALNAAGYPSFNVAVPSMKAQPGVQNGDDQFRRWIAGWCDGMINAMGHNDSSNAGTYLPTMNANYAAALRGVKRVVQTTFPPTTTVGTSNNWTTSPRSLQVQASPWNYSAGTMYATVMPAVRSLSYNNAAYIDLSAYCGNLDGTATVDGNWPVDGATAYKYTVDGTHPSKDGHAGIASQVTSSVLSTALGF